MDPFSKITFNSPLAEKMGVFLEHYKFDWIYHKDETIDYFILDLEETKIYLVMNEHIENCKSMQNIIGTSLVVLFDPTPFMLYLYDGLRNFRLGYGYYLKNGKINDRIYIYLNTDGKIIGEFDNNLDGSESVRIEIATVENPELFNEAIDYWKTDDIYMSVKKQMLEDIIEKKIIELKKLEKQLSNFLGENL